MEYSQYLIIPIVFLAVVVVALIVHLKKERKKIISYLDVLSRIEAGDENAKIFVNSTGTIAELGFKTNKIIAAYKLRIEELKKSEQLNKQLLTGLSHDVRTPLTSLLGYLDAIDDGVVKGEESTEYIKIARNKAYNLKGFVDTLFEWSKLDSKERIFHFELMDINECMRNIIIGWLPIFEQKNIHFKLDIPEDEILIKIDREAFERIINNLVQNAVSHSGATCINIGIEACEKGVFVGITDNGQGIQEAKLPFVFERLYKCDDARSERGSGLGLAITKEFVTAHGGTITVTSKPYERTTFTVLFPTSR